MRHAVAGFGQLAWQCRGAGNSSDRKAKLRVPRFVQSRRVGAGKLGRLSGPGPRRTEREDDALGKTQRFVRRCPSLLPPHRHQRLESASSPFAGEPHATDKTVSRNVAERTIGEAAGATVKRDERDSRHRRVILRLVPDHQWKVASFRFAICIAPSGVKSYSSGWCYCWLVQQCIVLKEHAWASHPWHPKSNVLTVP